ncbi:hypothetical protein DWW67_06045 [Coprobacillus sp. AF16-47]|jgi:hypothetical protein|nr:hypothetical protein DWW67_06045 [Coprobacillus sp. AF16-47]
MGLLYNATKWLDHVTQFPMRKRITQNSDGTSDVVRAEGEIIQQGTPRNASNYNNIETGILANQIHILVLQQEMLQIQRATEENHGEFGEVVLKNTNKYPFPSPSVTVEIKEKRSNLNYTVAIEVTKSDGNVEIVEIFDKQLNGFKMAFKGSAKNVTIKYKITGGRY